MSGQDRGKPCPYYTRTCAASPRSGAVVVYRTCPIPNSHGRLVYELVGLNGCGVIITIITDISFKEDWWNEVGTRVIRNYYYHYHHYQYYCWMLRVSWLVRKRINMRMLCGEVPDVNCTWKGRGNQGYWQVMYVYSDTICEVHSPLHESSYIFKMPVLMIGFAAYHHFYLYFAYLFFYDQFCDASKTHWQEQWQVYVD